MSFCRHNIQDSIWSEETPSEQLPSIPAVSSTGDLSKQRGCISQAIWITSPGCFHEPPEHILEQCLDVLVKFLKNFFNDSVCSLSELCFVTFNIQQMYLAHVQFLILIDEEFFILFVLPGTRSIFSSVLSVSFSFFNFSSFLHSPAKPKCHSCLFRTVTPLGSDTV